LNGIELERPSESRQAVHTFGSDITAGREVNIVERHEQLKRLREREGPSGVQPKESPQHSANGKDELNFLIFSEIAFDTKHKFAVLRWIVVCGQHCDSGSTLVMEKVDGRWAPSSRRPCAMFLNNYWSEMPD
jgi:hypothetical protein